MACIVMACIVMAGQLLSNITGGLITTIPTSMADAKKLLLDMLEFAKKKAGELLGKLTGGVITFSGHT